MPRRAARTYGDCSPAEGAEVVTKCLIVAKLKSAGALVLVYWRLLESKNESPDNLRSVIVSPRIGILLTVAMAFVILAQVSSDESEAQEAEGLQLTVRNVTGGQPLTPPIAVVHEPGVSLLPTNADDLDGLEELAEAGEQTVLAASLGQMSGVKQVVSFEPPPIRPRRQSAVSISASPGDHVSVIAMLACTNDAITFGTLVIHEDGAPSFSSGRVLDAGTENNDETAATVPCLDGEGVSGAGAADGEGMIASHPGITGNADLEQDTRGWDGPAMQLVLSAADAGVPQTLEFGLTLENLTAGQPITPPVAVVHDPNVAVFDYTSPTELDGIDDLAEGGAQADLLATLYATPGVVRAYGLDSGGPIAPGGSYTANVLDGIEGASVTVVGMFACTNDGYIRASHTLTVLGGRLSIPGPSTALVFDSGSENNDETSATVPCLGGSGAAFSEGLGEGMRTPHAGIAGTADLNQETHGWTEDKTAMVYLHGPVKMDTLDLQVTVRNITVGQTITHPVVIVHTGLLATLPEDAATIDGLEILAESGEPSPFSRGVTVVPGVKSATVMADSGPIPGGEEATLTNVSAAAGDYISVIGMLACTNDAVTYGTVALSKWGSTPAMSSGAVLDAGTEDNSETAATVPCLGGESVSGADIDDGEGMVALHPGIGGDASLVQETHGWDGPAMQIVVTGTGEEEPESLDFGLTIENLMAGQPITPPVAVVHDPEVQVFDYNIPTQLDGIDDLSEGGVQTDLLATLSVMPGVVRAYGLDSGGPILPGGSYTADVLNGIAGANVTVVGMLACTNDGYIRVSQPLTIFGGAPILVPPATALVFDSGSEDNDETSATVPCLGGGTSALSEGLGEGMRSPHPGIAGTADLSQETHGWTDDNTAFLFLHSAFVMEEETPTPSPTPEPTSTPVPTSTPEPTATSEPTATPAPTPTPEPTATSEPTSTPVPTPTPEPTATSEPTSTPVPTSTPEPTSTPVPTATPQPTATSEPAPTWTPEPTWTPVPGAEAPATGDYAPSSGSILVIGLIGSLAALAGFALVIGRRRVGGHAVRGDE